MLIYTILVALIILMSSLLSMNRITKKQFCIVVGLAFVLITGLRSVNVGSDTTVYYLDFITMKDRPIEYIFAPDRRDVIYFLLSWIVAKTIGSFVFITMFTAIVFYYPVMKLIYKYSKDPGLSCLVLMAFNFFQFSMTGVRQTIAFGLVILFFIELHEKGRFGKKGFFYILLASLFHLSAIIALMYPLIKRLSKRRIFVQLLLVLVPISFLFGGYVIRALQGVFVLLGFDLITPEYLGGGFTTFLVYVVITVGAFLLSPKDSEGAITSNEMILYAIFGTSMQAFVLASSIFFRVAWYFALFFIIIIPEILIKSRVASKERQILKVFVYLGVLFMYFFITKGSATVLPYEFFWQG